MKQNGFTLIELLVAVTVVGILAAVAIPNYTDHITESKLKQAHAALMDTRTAMEQVYQDNRAYNCANITPIQTEHFTMACAPAGDTQTYTLTSTGRANSGVADFTFTINESNVRTSAKGGSSNATCWSTRASGAC